MHSRPTLGYTGVYLVYIDISGEVQVGAGPS